jgi:hypothetical protein
MRIDIADERAAEILGNALDGKSPSKEEMRHLATVEGTDVSLSLFQVARRITEKNLAIEYSFMDSYTSQHIAEMIAASVIIEEPIAAPKDIEKALSR